MCVPYFRWVAAVKRLNEVCGPYWQTALEYEGGHVFGGVGILVDGEWVWRWHGTGLLEPSDDPRGLSQQDAGKGNVSNALKGAALAWGIGLETRYMQESFAKIHDDGRYFNNIKGHGGVKWDPPDVGTRPGAPPPQRPGEPPPKAAPEPSEAEQLESVKKELADLCREKRIKTYHLDAVVQLDRELPDRWDLFQARDFRVLRDIARDRPQYFDEAMRQLSAEYSTSPERIEMLEALEDELRVGGADRVIIQSAKAIGWNDAVEYWIDELNRRKRDG